MPDEYEDRANAEEQRSSAISALPKTLAEQQRALADMARAQEPLDGKRFRLHTANALYLAQEAFEHKAARSGGLENKLPKMSRGRAERSLMASEYFRRFCSNQKSAAGMAKLFEGELGAMNALRQFGAAIRQVEKERSARAEPPSEPAPEPKARTKGPAPERA